MWGIWSSLHHSQTINLTENFISWILLKIPSIITRSKSFLTSEVMDSVGDQKTSSEHQKTASEGMDFLKKFPLKLLNNLQIFLKKKKQIWALNSGRRIVVIAGKSNWKGISNYRTRPKVLISSIIYCATYRTGLILMLF